MPATTITVVSSSLGTTTLDPNLEWIDKADQTAAAGSEFDTLGGRVIIQRLYGVTSGRLITLAAIENGNSMKGYFSAAVRDNLITLRDSGETVTLNYHGTSFSAVIPLTGISLNLFDGCVDSDTNNWYSGTVTFKTV